MLSLLANIVFDVFFHLSLLVNWNWCAEPTVLKQGWIKFTQISNAFKTFCTACFHVHSLSFNKCFVIFSPYLCIGNHSCSRSLKVPDPSHHCLGRANQVCCCYTCTINKMFLTKGCLIWCLMSWLKVGMWYWFADIYFLFVNILMILMICLQISLTETGLSPRYVFPWKERMKTVIAWQIWNPFENLELRPCWYCSRRWYVPRTLPINICLCFFSHELQKLHTGKSMGLFDSTGSFAQCLHCVQSTLFLWSFEKIAKRLAQPGDKN